MSRARRSLPRMILARRWPASQADRLRIVDACAERLLEAYDEIDQLKAELRRRRQPNGQREVPAGQHQPPPPPFTLGQ